MKMHRQLALPVVALVALTGCYDQILVPGDEANERIEVTNDEWVLGQRVNYPDTNVPIDESVLTAFRTSPAPSPGRWSIVTQRTTHREGVMAVTAGPAMAPSSITLTLETEVDPPTVSGEVVQATSVWVTGGNKAVVSYNFRGNPALGGVDYLEKLDKDVPRLKSSAIFNDTDVNAVTLDDNAAYLAELSSDPLLPSSAIVERIRFRGKKFTLDDATRAPVASFAATSVMIARNILYATSGDGGAVYAFDQDDLSPLGEFALDDARWVAWDEDGDRILVAQGTPGRISVFEEGVFPGGSMNLLASYPFPGANVPESKSTVEVAGELAFIAAGPEGVQVMCIETGEIVGNVPRPDPASLGLDPSVVVTNSVTVDDDVMFISNGEGGIYAAAADDDFDDIECGDPVTIQMLGRLRFDDLESANHIMYRGKTLYVAAGLGGIKIVEADID